MALDDSIAHLEFAGSDAPKHEGSMLSNLSAKMMAHMTERSQEAGEDTGR